MWSRTAWIPLTAAVGVKGDPHTPSGSVVTSGVTALASSGVPVEKWVTAPVLAGARFAQQRGADQRPAEESGGTGETHPLHDVAAGKVAGLELSFGGH